MIEKSTQQKTLVKSVRLDGIGLHSGQKVELYLIEIPQAEKPLTSLKMEM